jgi:hypothetical protein
MRTSPAPGRRRPGRPWGSAACGPVWTVPTTRVGVPSKVVPSASRMSASVAASAAARMSSSLPPDAAMAPACCSTCSRQRSANRAAVRIRSSSRALLRQRRRSTASVSATRTPAASRAAATRSSRPSTPRRPAPASCAIHTTGWTCPGNSSYVSIRATDVSAACSRSSRGTYSVMSPSAGTKQPTGRSFGEWKNPVRYTTSWKSTHNTPSRSLPRRARCTAATRAWYSVSVIGVAVVSVIGNRPPRGRRSGVDAGRAHSVTLSTIDCSPLGASVATPRRHDSDTTARARPHDTG